MPTSPIQKTENRLLDVLKYIASILILASHCRPLLPNELFNFFYGQWFFRFCVPLFIISSGYFFASFDKNGKWKYLKRIVILYAISSLLYLPLYMGAEIVPIIRNLVFGYRHLWYLSALSLALCFLCVLEHLPAVRKIFDTAYPYIAVVLILIGAFFDEYKNVFSAFYNMPIIEKLGSAIDYFGGSRHALFFVLPMILIGRFIFERREKIGLEKAGCIALAVLSFGLSFAECVMLKHFGGISISCDITLFNFLPAVFLFILTFKWNPQSFPNIRTKTLRKHADVIYVLHILVLFGVDKLLGVTYTLRFLLTMIISMLSPLLYFKAATPIKEALKKRKCK